MGGFSFWHILLLAVILLLVFGGNRFSNMMGDVAKGLKSFKQGMADDDEEERRRDEERRREAERRRLSHDQPIDVTPEPRRTETVTPPPPPPADDHR
jgi:sec-independent protein translocase protein TatA